VEPVTWTEPPSSNSAPPASYLRSDIDNSHEVTTVVQRHALVRTVRSWTITFSARANNDRAGGVGAQDVAAAETPEIVSIGSG